MPNSPIIIRKFNPLHCGEGGLFIPLALGQVFLNCPLPTHLQLTLSRLRGKITRWEVYKSDLLTYSRGVQIRPSHIFTFHTSLQPTKVPTTFGDLRESEPWRFHQRAISRHLRSRSWSLYPKVLVFELVLLSNRSSPSAGRRRYPSSPKVLVFALALLGSHSSPSAYRRWYPSSRRSRSLSLYF